MTHFYLARHGQNEDNLERLLNGHRDRPLTETGREEARAIAETLKDKPIEAVYSSPLKRARETATIIAEKLGLDVRIEPNLIERDFGIMAGQPIANILELPPDNVLHTDHVNYFLEAEGAEGFPALYRRGQVVIEKMRRTHPNQHVLLVAHSDINKMIQAAYYGWDWKTGLMAPYIGHGEVIELMP